MIFFVASEYGVMTFFRGVFDLFYTICIQGHDFFRLTLYGVRTFFIGRHTGSGLF